LGHRVALLPRVAEGTMGIPRGAPPGSGPSLVITLLIDRFLDMHAACSGTRCYKSAGERLGAMTGADGGVDPGSRPGWRWDVALSFAGAQRDYIEQVARALKARGVRCFYDADEE
jgi:hypothetical protein